MKIYKQLTFDLLFSPKEPIKATGKQRKNSVCIGSPKNHKYTDQNHNNFSNFSKVK